MLYIEAALIKLKPSIINVYWRNISLQIVKKENRLQPLIEQEEKIAHLAYQIGGDEIAKLIK